MACNSFTTLSSGLWSYRELRSNCKLSRPQASLRCIGSSARRSAGWRLSGQYTVSPLKWIADGLEWLRAFKMQSYFEKQNDLHLNQSQVGYSIAQATDTFVLIGQGPFYFRFAGQAFLRTALSIITMILAVSLASLAVGLRRTTNPSL